MNLIFNLIYFICLSLSVSYMWSFSDIFRPLRNTVAKIPFIKRPLLCPDCSSFWFGFGVSFLYNPIVLNYFNYILVTNIFAGLVTHLIASILYKNVNIYDK
jgi:hypothetical protein